MFRICGFFALLFLAAGCRVGERRYEGKEVCELIQDRDIAEIFGEPFLAGKRAGLNNDGNSHIGSQCDFQSVARNPRLQQDYKFRVLIEVRTVEPGEADMAAQRKRYETTLYNGRLLYHKVQEVAGVADGAFGAFDAYSMFILSSVFKPDVRMEVHVFHVVEQEAVERAKAVAQRLDSRLRAEGVAAKPR